MRWTVHDERVLYDSDWIRLALADVEVPGGARFDQGRAVSLAGVTSDDVDQEREKLSAGSGNKRSGGGSNRPLSAAPPGFAGVKPRLQSLHNAVDSYGFAC